MKSYIIKRSSLYIYSIDLLVIAFVTFYFTDGMSKILLRTGSDFHRYSAFVKGFFEIFILGFAIVTVTRSKLNLLASLGLFLISFLIGQFFLSLNFPELLFYENFNSLFKYLFTLILFLLALDIIKNNEHPFRLFKYYRLILVFNSIVIILGFLLKIEMFKTYPGPWRFGYDGLTLAQNEASYIFIFAITTVYYRRFYLKIKEYFFWVILISSLLVATKAVYLYLVLLLLFHIVKRVSIRNILTFGISLLTVGYLLFSTAVNKIFKNSYDIFMYMYYKGGLWNALLSGRNDYIMDKLAPLVFEHWSFPNFFFGGQDVVSHYIEMGFIDLLLFFGIFGTILYLFIFYSIFKTIPFPRDFKIFFGISLTIIIATAGHFFESGIAGLHFIFLLLINRNIEKQIT